MARGAARRHPGGMRRAAQADSGCQDPPSPANNRELAGAFQGAVFRSGSIHRFERWDPMDSQTKHELWLLAIGTILFEAPFLAVAALAFAGH
jgi:hypothetical protein